MTTMITLSEARLPDPLILADQHIAEAKQRREHQIRVVSGLPRDTDARAYAEMLLREIDRTIAIGRMHQELIHNLRD
jgi:hypothetical protein